MASIDELRQSDQRSARNRGRFVVSGLLQRLSVLLLVLVSALGAVLLNELANRGQAKNAVPSFVQKELGAQRAAERLARKTGPKTTAKILSSGYEVSSPSGAVRLTQTGTAGKAWVRYANGTTRSTAFGNEAIVLGGDHADGEQYLTVHAHHGLHTWKWRLATGSLRPVLRPDGSVLVSPAHVVGGFRILPLEIFDTGGKNVTPAGAGWGLERKGKTLNLTLSLDDSELPVPYVIDPATEAFRAAASANTGANATTLTIAKPAALALNDVMIAAITARGGTNTFVCAPAGWTSIRADNSTTVLHQEVFWKAATAADVAAANFVFTFGTSATCATTTSLQAAGGIAAFYGINDAAPIDASNGQANASSTTVTAPAVTNATVGNFLVGAFGSANGAVNFWTNAALAERWDAASTAATAANRAASELATVVTAATGSTGN